MLKKQHQPMMAANRRPRGNGGSNSLSYCMGLRAVTRLTCLVLVSWLCWMGRRMKEDVSFMSSSASSSSFWWRSTAQSPQRHATFSSSRRRTTTKNRSTVRPNEFFLPPNESLWRYFDESASRPLDFSLHSSNNDDVGQLPALWQCHVPSKKEGAVALRRSSPPKHRHSKIIFIHLRRSAGNMVRSLLQYYGKHCQTSYAIITACTDLSFQSAQAGYWYNGRRRRQGNHCQLKEALNRTQAVTWDRKKGYVSTAFLEKVDIIAGQLPLGSADQAWKYYHEEGPKTTTTTTPVKVQYVIFLRDPIAKFISEEVARGWRTLTTTESAVALIQQKVQAERSKGHYHDSYTPSLITPEQHFQYEFHEVRPTMDQFVNVTMSNLVDLNVLIGIVERMPQSLQLLQHVLDSQHNLNVLFQYFGVGKTESPRPMWPRNKKPGLTTVEVLRQVKQDGTLYRALKEYVKYELNVYHFALELHQRQYQKLPQQPKPKQQQQQQVEKQQLL